MEKPQLYLITDKSDKFLDLEVALVDLDYQIIAHSESIPDSSQLPQQAIDAFIVLDHLKPKHLLAHNNTILKGWTMLSISDDWKLSDLPRLVQEIERTFSEPLSERALQKAFDAYHDIMASFSDGLILMDPHFRPRYLNMAIERITGFEVAELLTKTPQEIIYHEDLELVQAAIKQCQNSPGESIRYEFRHLCKDGSFVLVETIARNLIGVEGIDSYVVVVRDISQRSQEQEQIQISEQRYRIVTEQTGQMVYDWDIQTGQIHWAGAIEQITGFSHQEYQNVDIERWEAMIHPEDRTLSINALERAEKSGEPYGVEYRHQRKDGSYVYVEDHGLFLKDSHGNRCRMLGSMKDISERKQASIAVQRALQDRDLLLQELQHRVKNNFQLILSMLNMQIRRLGESEALPVLMDAHNRILSLALVHEKLYQLDQLGNIDLADYLKLLAREVHASHHNSQSNIQLRLNLESVPTSVEQAISCGLLVNELLMNSFKHAFRESRPDQPIISVNLKATPELSICLSIRDNGTGCQITQREQDNTLGLQLVHQLIRQLNGRFEVDSQQGTHWEIEFALAN